LTQLRHWTGPASEAVVYDSIDAAQS